MRIGLVKNRVIVFDYVNYRGESSTRRVLVDLVYFGTSEYHQEPQMIMQAYDLAKHDMRGFAVKDMSRVGYGDLEDSERVAERIKADFVSGITAKQEADRVTIAWQSEPEFEEDNHTTEFTVTFDIATGHVISSSHG